MRQKNHPFAPGLLLALLLTSCATVSDHPFATPGGDWETRSGQLMYHTAQRALIGDVLIRLSKKGDFEMTFSKGPGVTLFTLRQDATFAEMRGALAGPGWSGNVATAPAKLRGWLGLRDRLLKAGNEKTIRYVSGGDTFTFRF